jgi:hypothetical protein
MSTKTPITQEPVECGTNWLTRLACKLQNFVEPLCEKNDNFVLTLEEQSIVLCCLRVSNPNWKGRISPFLGMTVKQLNQLNQLNQRIDISELCYSESIKYILEPRLTIWNKIGLSVWKVFSIGTKCSCCWGFRLLTAIAISYILGYASGNLICL